MTSSPERTARKTLVASIVALHGNGCKQASYSVHVTISRKRKRRGEQINIFLNTRRLELVGELKYLGIYLDRRLTFNKHI
jgi:hypothetical protein